MTKPALRSVVFEVTTRCNLDCKFCYNPWKAIPGSRGKTEGYAQARKTLRRMLQIARPQHLTFSGGEPLSAERLPELILLARMQGVFVSILSNGTLADPETLRQLRQAGVGKMQFSMHADRALEHERLTGAQGSWEKVHTAFRTAAACGIQTGGIMVLTALNAARVAQTLALFAELKAGSILLNRFNIGGRGIACQDELMPDRETLKAAFAKANDFVASGGIPVHSGVCTPVCVLDPLDYPALSFGRCGASLRATPLTLDTDGNLRVCNHSPVTIGNIFKQTIEEMEASPYLREWGTTRPAFCADCADFPRCFAGCRAAAEQLGQGLDADPVLFTKRR